MKNVLELSPEETSVVYAALEAYRSQLQDLKQRSSTNVSTSTFCETEGKQVTALLLRCGQLEY